MSTEPTKPNPPRPPGVYRVMAIIIGPLEHWLGLGCRSFTRLASVRLDRPLTFGERLAYRMHWLICAICRKQASHTNCLHELLRLGSQDQKLATDNTLSAEAKEKLRNKLAEEAKRS